MRFETSSIPPVDRRGASSLALALFVVLQLVMSPLQAGISAAQGSLESQGAQGIAGRAPDVPPGTASIFGQLLHPEGNAKTEGSSIVLYSLATDGSPGIRTTVADASGVFSFSELSSASGITYLIGVSYRGIPYGKRVAFEPGQDEIALVIDVDDPSNDTSLVSVADTSLQVEWIGASLGIEEVHQLENSGDEVIFVPPDQRGDLQPPFRVTLPQGIEQLDTTLSGIAEGYEVRGSELIFWGPVYADGLELRYRYLVPIATTAEAGMKLRWTLESGSRRASLLFPPTGPTLSVQGASTGADVTLGDRPFRALYLGALSAGSSFEVAVTLPEMSNDQSAISFSRADFWLDADDTFLQVNFELYLEVAPGAHLTGSAEAPLVRFELPPDAEFRGYSQEAQNLGLLPIPGGLGLIGPLSPGTEKLGFTYRLPVVDDKPQIDLRLPGPVKVLNVLIADTGVVVETDRLHRLRPFRQGTRIYLHREAFSIEQGETVSVGLELINRGAERRNTNLFAVSALAGLGVWFIVSPLVRGRRQGGAHFEQARIRDERELVYASIRDLEHDFETTKIEEVEYQTMRAELRGRALTLLQQERDAEKSAERSPRTEPSVAQDQTQDTAAENCRDCGNVLNVGWQFCPKCGASQGPGDGTPSTDTDTDAEAKANA